MIRSSFALVVALTQMVLSDPIKSGSDFSLVPSINKFSLDLLRQCSKSGQNEIMSPFSVYTALTMVHLGARGKTKQELTTVLGLPQSEGKKAVAEKFQATQRTLDSQVDASHNGVTLLSANQLYVQSGMKLKQDFQSHLKQIFNAGVEHVDFSDQAGAAEIINDWVAKSTKDKIQDLFSEDSITPDLAAVLVNAVYFKGQWKYKFDPMLTRKMDFTPSDGTKIQVDTMFSHTKLNVTDVDINGQTATAVLYPYQGDTLSMVFVLPEEGKSVDDLVTGLDTPDTIQAIRQGLAASQEDCELYLPKFKTTKEYDLVEPLMKLGLLSIFKKQGDLEIVEEPIGIDAFIHKAVIEINEEGAEAAAASAAGMGRRSLVVNHPRVVALNRPFVFYIQETNSVDTLFSRVADLSGIMASEVHVSRVVHKVVVEVSEEGTEAAATTGVEIMARALVMPNIVKLDRPFVFYIQDNSHGMVILSGKIENPEE